MFSLLKMLRHLFQFAKGEGHDDAVEVRNTMR